jgi:pyrrolysine biosynthesis protein PylD
MTRLKGEDVKDIGKQLKDYDISLVKITGLTLREIARRAVGISEEEMNGPLAGRRVAVIPITCGGGIIEGFVETVGKILNHIGANVFQSRAADLGGFAEAIEQGADILFCADDERFVALNLALRKVVDNTEATARGYVEALEHAVGGLNGQEVLVIGGAGRLGWNAVLFLLKKGARVSVYDADRDRLLLRSRGYDVMVEHNLEEALKKHLIFFDASPAPDLIRPEHIKPETIIAAPGIPLGLTEDAYVLVQDRLIHDPLQMGVATMFVEAISTPL